MSSSPRPGRPGSAAGVAAVLSDVRASARAGAEALLQHVPDTGDHTTGRAVDDFVEQAVDALRALAEAVGETLAVTGDGDGPLGAEPVDDHLRAVELPPRGWHW